ncbi:MAG: HDOD domain-containing protein [Deltaproteobacteria bacterium]|nr:HDOD domain-containing protein [Deltaproteobacteria bacterium]
MNVYVARQPVFTRSKKIFGYELLFRDGLSNAFPDIDGDTATSKLLSSSFLTMDIDSISGKKKAFINFTRELLVKKIPTMFPRKNIIVEILEHVEPDEDVVSACKDMQRSGYEFALDDFIYGSKAGPLIDLAGIVKIDFRLNPHEAIGEILNKLAGKGIKFLAEKVETYDEFQLALDMGFHYFQGYFFSKPQILKARDISPLKLHLLQIVVEANKDDVSFGKLEELISQDISISYKLMRYINSAYFRRINDISSIRQAIVLLGEREIRRFLSLIAMASLSEGKPDELIRASIIRARLCELLGKYHFCRDESELFTLGLFSLIDAILDNSMENLMNQLPLSSDIKRALIKGEGELADFIRLTSCYEAGDWEGISETASKIGVSEKEVPGCYMDAVGWADSYSED